MEKRQKIILFTAVGVPCILIAFVAYAVFVPWSQVLGKTVYSLDENKANPKILLTFDDGPGPETPAIFEELKEANISAIFFVVCSQVSEEEKGLLMRMAQEGQEIGLHAANHIVFEDVEDIIKCKQELENITGRQIKYYRPPYGIKTFSKAGLAKRLNMTIMTWSILPKDYNAISAEEITLNVEKSLKPGAIICLHDGPENRQNTAEALPGIIRYARESGYEFESP